jgi:hypothetical protein
MQQSLIILASLSAAGIPCLFSGAFTRVRFGVVEAGFARFHYPGFSFSLLIIRKNWVCLYLAQVATLGLENCGDFAILDDDEFDPGFLADFFSQGLGVFRRDQAGALL